ncbi:DUF2314 domain-containing protein [Duganella sp. Root336D2]|nr:DUF2314 domain-containing protein [Duganella sp. Root336D2]KQV45399.1 hypothetical protein ASD07_17960 [Duganella sp. Root336D2]KRB93628.1 hypothetical protein ASE26_27665 [Duganella sp. Root198D2]
MSNEELVPLFIPALGVLLVNMEDEKGSPLDEDEVLALRDKASVMMVSKEHFESMAESRGYADLDPENCWYDWQMLRRKLGRKPDLDPGARFSFVSKDNEEFQATIVAAQDTLGEFRHLLVDASQQKFPLVKTLLSEPDYRAYIWLSVVSHDSVGFVGEIFELPSGFKEYLVGDQIEVPDSEVKDWMINDEGKLHGGYSLRYARSKMSDAERAAFDEHVGVESYVTIGS